jgi:hypothetical protein
LSVANVAKLQRLLAADDSNPLQHNPEEQRVVTSRKATNPHVNRLLGLLSPRDYKRLHPHLHRMPLEYRQSLYRAHKPIGFVYFIETGVGSLVNTMANGQAAEVGTIVFFLVSFHAETAAFISPEFKLHQTFGRMVAWSYVVRIP